MVLSAGRLIGRRIWIRWVMVVFHALFAAAWFFPDINFRRSLIVWVVLQLGVHVGYHRYFAHVSFKTHPWFEFLLAGIGCLSFQNGPLWWASKHRRHHRLSDTADDYHSPARGLWHAHIGWLWDVGVEEIDGQLIPDLFRPIPLLVERHQRILHLLYAALLVLFLGWSAILTLWIIPIVICWHTTFATNSICHLVGSQPFVCRPRGLCLARNNAIVAILNLGEGWHNNHHAHPAWAHHGFYRWYQFDFAYLVLIMLNKLHIIWALQRCPSSGLMGQLADSTKEGSGASGW
jgi:stearoyl-CoA desaturase (delta-9 desaturase)